MFIICHKGENTPFATVFKLMLQNFKYQLKMLAYSFLCEGDIAF